MVVACNWKEVVYIRLNQLELTQLKWNLLAVISLDWLKLTA